MTSGQSWAEEFDQYILRSILDQRQEDTIHFEHAGESAQLAVPSMDHFAPLLTVFGARDKDDIVSVFNADCAYASLSMTSYLFHDKPWQPTT